MGLRMTAHPTRSGVLQSTRTSRPVGCERRSLAEPVGQPPNATLRSATWSPSRSNRCRSAPSRTITVSPREAIATGRRSSPGPLTPAAETPQQVAGLVDAMDLRAPPIQNEPGASMQNGIGDREHLGVQPRPGWEGRRRVVGCFFHGGALPASVAASPGHLQHAPGEYRRRHRAGGHRQPRTRPPAGCFRVPGHRFEGAMRTSARWPRDPDSAVSILIVSGELEGSFSRSGGHHPNRPGRAHTCQNGTDFLPHLRPAPPPRVYNPFSTARMSSLVGRTL